MAPTFTQTMPLSSGFLDRRDPDHLPARHMAFVKGRVVLENEAPLFVDPDPGWLSVYLGSHNGQAYFAQDMSHAEALLGQPTDLWFLPREFAQEYIALACQGQHLLRWHARHPLCAKCGSATEPRSLGRHRHCPTCESDIYPRTDPAVIMLVQSPDLQRIVMAHTHVMPPGLQSLLAGYVEPGETLEDTVRRETFEEAGLRVKDVRYVASQPWALSGSLMCGFTCVAEDETLNIDPDELESAAWFSRDDLAKYKADTTSIFPRRNTIARYLIDQWWKS